MTDSPKISKEEIGNYLNTKYLGRALLIADVLESTNLTAEAIADQSPEGLVVIAEQQTGGRGRNGRSWASPAERNLYCSIILKPDCAPEYVPQLAIVTAISIAEVLEQLSIDNIQIKWPNDIWLNMRKLCGILCSMSCIENCTEHAVVGIGININTTMQDLPAELSDKATSLRMHTGMCFNRSKVLAMVLNALEHDYEQWEKLHSLAPFQERWRKYDLLCNRTISAEHGRDIISGKVLGIENDGRLKLKTDNGIILISAGDAHIKSL